MASLTWYVVQAFDQDDEGNLIPRQPQQATSADGARRMALAIDAGGAAGVLAFSRTGDPEEGDYGPPTIIHRAGRVPDEME